MNSAHISIPEVQRLFDQKLDEISDIEQQALTPLALQLDTALGLIGHSTAFRIIHPLLIRRYARATMKYRKTPINCIGLDVETVHTTGRLKLLGTYYPSADHYRAVLDPDLNDLYEIVSALADNKSDTHIAVWGRLDIQVILQMFDPSESERRLISRGISARVFNGAFDADPPIQRDIGTAVFYVAHYIPGRSLKLGILKDGFEATVWVFNLSQFFPGTIEQTANALSFDWTSFERDTHLVDWERYATDADYADRVRRSNEQDARAVERFSAILQEQFHATFGVYPSLLVSTGSLTDAAVSEMLSEDDYKACSWDWLRHHVWKDGQQTVAKAETLLAEAFSAGYVDQFAIGYFPSVCTADIAAAYPHKIRNLPDLRECEIIEGEGWDLLEAFVDSFDVESAVIRGTVTIPQTLRFHPITIKTYNRENYRPTGTFHATYTLEEREFCRRCGATFENEEWCAFAIQQRRPSPLAVVSTKLGQLRDSLLEEMRSSEGDRRIFLDGQQYVTKVIDNSIYGKTVMTTEYVENIDGIPQITGYVAGDRFNLLYGCLITARTRIQIAEACNEILMRGGRPIMTMTDSIYWEGRPTDIDQSTIRTEKTPGFFEPPTQVEDFYILKTGQYEYRAGTKWSYKLRGLPVDWEFLHSFGGSFFRSIVIEGCGAIKPTTHPSKIQIPVSARRLISIGSPDLAHLGMVSEQTMMLKPFVLSSKQAERFVLDWPFCLDGHSWLQTPRVKDESGATQAPLFFLADLYTDKTARVLTERKTRTRMLTKRRVSVVKDSKRLFVWRAQQRTHKAPPDGTIADIPWEDLEAHFKITRHDLYR